MEITYNGQEHTFLITNGRISYVFSVEKNRYLAHRYFGRNIRNYHGGSKPYFYDRGFCSNPVPEDRTFSLDTLPQEYPDMKFFISENGMGVEHEDRFRDAEGEIQDDYRIEFVRDHLEWVMKAIEEGANCVGYHYWGVIDNWSWSNAFKNRYGFI